MSNTQDELTWSNIALRVGMSTILHPIEYAKVLIQIGCEPVSPYPTTTLFGKPALALPNVFKYVSYIKTVDGVSGCFRGLSPKICGNIMFTAVYSKTSERLKVDGQSEEEHEGITEEERRWRFLRKLYLEISARTVAIIASQPLSVVTFRMMAQFVGGETKYSGIFCSLVQIYRDNGISGYFSGLIPRWLGDISSMLIASTLTYVINTYIVDDKDIRYIVSSSMTFIASALTYPFQLVSTCMAVADSGLAAGRPPNMPLYTSWIDCWSHLRQTNQMKRGSSLVWRYYTGPNFSAPISKIGQK